MMRGSIIYKHPISLSDESRMLIFIEQIAKIIQSFVSVFLLIGIVIAYFSWKSKQNLDRRNMAIGYSLTKNRQYFDARGEIASRFKNKLAKDQIISADEVQSLKENNDKIINDIKFVLSHWEIMSISIIDDIIDEKTCFEMVGSTLVSTVGMLEMYIEDARKEAQNVRRYDYLLIIYHEWKTRLEDTRGVRPISRFQQYLDLEKDRSKFERRLESDKNDWL